MGFSKHMLAKILIIVSVIVLVSSHHIPSHFNFAVEEPLQLNQRFFNDVRELIKRRLLENAEIQGLHLANENDLLTNTNSNTNINDDDDGSVSLLNPTLSQDNFNSNSANNNNQNDDNKDGHSFGTDNNINNLQMLSLPVDFRTIKYHNTDDINNFDNNVNVDRSAESERSNENTSDDSKNPTHPMKIPTPVLVENWPKEPHSFGQVTAVSIDPEGNPVIFHRADRYWDVNTFNESNIYFLIEYGPIKEKTVYILDPKTGKVQSGWGEELFYMPHGMTIDKHGNYWFTDVAMHQAFKFKPFEVEPQLVIGKRFKPGSSVNYLCKPTSIAVASTGEFFIADGYCNSRILKFNAAGRLLRTIPQPPEFLSLQVPHAVTLLEHLDLLCIADRENMRVVCPKAGLISSQGEGQPAATIQEPDLGRVFGVAAYGDLVYAVNGPTSMLPVRGFTIDPRSETIVGHWGEFKNPHSIAACVNGSALYVSEIGTNHQTNRISKYVLV